MPGPRVALLLAAMDRACEVEHWFAPLHAAVAGVTAEQALWRPAPGSHSIRALVHHLVFWKEHQLHALRGEPATGVASNEATFGERDAGDEEGWRALRERLLAAQAALRAEVAALDDADLDRPFGSSPSLGAALLGLIGHDAYHAGQIVLLRKLQGSWPPSR
jgi:uncharacterized damage-inducible protein DinB